MRHSVYKLAIVGMGEKKIEGGGTTFTTFIYILLIIYSVRPVSRGLWSFELNVVFTTFNYIYYI